MCPFCILTAATIASGALTAGGLGVFLIGRARDPGKPASVTSGFPIMQLKAESARADNPQP